MIWRGRALLVCGVTLLIAACAQTPKPQAVPEKPVVSEKTVVSENLVVLLPNADGTTGQVEITNQGGSAVLSQPGFAVAVVDQTTAPGRPSPISEAEISRRFGPALAAQPEVPARYVLYFKQGSSQLTEESERLLPEILREISRRQSNDVNVVGHTDSVGSRDQNYRLGLSRASEVKNLLVRRGVDPRHIQVDSHGQGNQLVPTGNQVREPRNRRVEVTVR